jgi:thiamine-phosphate pyrophosphorylase
VDRESAAPGLMMVTDRKRMGARPLAEQVRAAAAAGLDFVQLREKDLAGGALLDLARELAEAVAGTATRLLVNGRPDVALAAAAAGVQLPAEGLPVSAVRAAFGTLVIGASCHDLAAARAAEEAGASLVVFGPVFVTPGKETRAQGLEALAQVARAVSIPVYAIGGVDAHNAARARAAGAAGVAAIRPFLADAAGTAVRALREAWRA